MNKNLEIYTALQEVPKEAQTPIEAGRLKGMTDIKPMWRIKALTEYFGPCGIGWKYTIERMWTEQSGDEIAVFVNINLYYKYNGEWSDAIPGTGGNMLRKQESKGMHTSDDCYKMALTDAISVAAKSLGLAGLVYWGNDPTKYSNENQPADKPITKSQKIQITELIKGTHITPEDIAAQLKNNYKKTKINELTPTEFIEFYKKTKGAVESYEKQLES